MHVTRGWLQSEDSKFLAILRSISIFIIVFGHVGGFWIYPPWSEYLQVFIPVFFFLSGAVSYNGYMRKKNIVQYLSKRIISLLVPYYCICMVALLVFLIQNSVFPEFNIGNFIRWATVIPMNSIMPFPLGQVWFLHTLIIISLISPLLFWLYNKNLFVFVLILCCSLLVSAIPIVFNIKPSFDIAGHNLFKPIVHMLFFCIGFIAFDNKKLRSAFSSTIIVIICLVISVVFVSVIGINPDYAEHTYSPDLYYVCGSVGSIWLFLLLKSHILKYYKALPSFIHNISEYFFRHTFAIYLLHSFSIYFIENVFGLVHPKEKSISYGILKLMLVLLVTLALSPVFTKISCLIANKLQTSLFDKYFNYRT